VIRVYRDTSNEEALVSGIPTSEIENIAIGTEHGIDFPAI